MVIMLVKYALYLLVAQIIQVPSLESCLDEERSALLALNSYMKSYTDYADEFQGIDNGTRQSLDCCTWERVRCDPTTQHVTKLNLGSMVSRENKVHDDDNSKMEPPWLFNVTLFSPFTQLISLNLSRNTLTGLVENNGSTRISTLKNLQVLNRDLNFFGTGQIDLSSLTSLKALSLSNCNLNQSNFPFQEMANMRELQVLDLSNNNFQGLIQELANLKNLQVLNLSNTQYSNGPIQGLCELKKLQELHFQSNQYNGVYPSCISNLTSLRVFDISNNFFQGKLSLDAFANLVSLEYLDLSNSNIEGELSLSSFANHSKLQILRLSGNKLDVQTEDSHWRPTFQLQSLDLQGCNLNKPMGTIPKFLSYQYDLRDIDLSNNGLVGNFPTWLIKNNSQLTSLLLKSNSLGGYFEFHNQSNLFLHKLDIANNDLQGELPENIGLMLPKVSELNMSSNHFEGEIPASMGQMSQLGTLDLSRNNFSGELPIQLLSNCSYMSILQLSDNKLQGDIISEQMNLPSLFWLKLNNNNFSGTIKDSLLRSRMLYHLDFSNNKVIGGLPSWIEKILTLKTLSVSKNLMQGLIPTEICHIPLSYLDLSWNNFTGPIPPCQFPPTVLHLRNNNLIGPLPNALSSGSNIETLDLAYNNLSGNIPPWINKLSNLQVFLLRGNNFHGQIPQELCQLKDIDILDLSNNNLSGRMPSCLGNMTLGSKHVTPSNTQVVFINPMSDLYSIPEEVEFLVKNNYLTYRGNVLVLMAGMDLSCNKLTGIIPPELGNLEQVHSLNLSHNYLSGVIPSNFANLKQVESLDLSYNDLSGMIPSQLVELNSLAIFNVSYNNLTGRTPETRQFGSMDPSGFLGNPGLCGLPVNKSCNPIFPPTNTNTNATEHGDGGGATLIEMEDFFWSFGVSSVIIFLTTLVVLCINPRWREAWFEFVGWHLLWWLPYDLF